MKKSIQKLRHKKGFSLVELVMTITVVGIISIPLSLFLSQHMESAFQSGDSTMAMNLARFEMEKVENMDYANIDTANFPDYQGSGYDVTRTVLYVQGDDLSAESLKQITVEVKKSGSASVLMSLDTYLSKNVDYGV